MQNYEKFARILTTTVFLFVHERQMYALRLVLLTCICTSGLCGDCNQIKTKLFSVRQDWVYLHCSSVSVGSVSWIIEFLTCWVLESKVWVKSQLNCQMKLLFFKNWHNATASKSTKMLFFCVKKYQNSKEKSFKNINL